MICRRRPGLECQLIAEINPPLLGDGKFMLRLSNVRIFAVLETSRKEANTFKVPMTISGEINPSISRK